MCFNSVRSEPRAALFSLSRNLFLSGLCRVRKVFTSAFFCAALVKPVGSRSRSEVFKWIRRGPEGTSYTKTVLSLYKRPSVRVSYILLTFLTRSSAESSNPCSQKGTVGTPAFDGRSAKAWLFTSQAPLIGSWFVAHSRD